MPHLGQCWVWTGRRTAKGYGALRFPGANTAHRAVWILQHGAIPVGHGYHGTCVLHRCDNPLCVRPEHLRLGTQLENIGDATMKARMARGDASGMALHPDSWTVGERSARARLTDQDVREIRDAAATGESRRSIGARLGIDASAITRIVNRKRWRHVV